MKDGWLRAPGGPEKSKKEEVLQEYFCVLCQDSEEVHTQQVLVK